MVIPLLIESGSQGNKNRRISQQLGHAWGWRCASDNLEELVPCSLERHTLHPVRFRSSSFVVLGVEVTINEVEGSRLIEESDPVSHMRHLVDLKGCGYQVGSVDAG